MNFLALFSVYSVWMIGLAQGQTIESVNSTSIVSPSASNSLLNAFPTTAVTSTSSSSSLSSFSLSSSLTSLDISESSALDSSTSITNEIHSSSTSGTVSSSREHSTSSTTTHDTTLSSLSSSIISTDSVQGFANTSSSISTTSSSSSSSSFIPVSTSSFSSSSSKGTSVVMSSTSSHTSTSSSTSHHTSKHEGSATSVFVSLTTTPISTMTSVVNGQTIYSDVYTTITATAVDPSSKKHAHALSSKDKKIVIGCVVGIGLPVLIALLLLFYYFFIKSRKINFIDSDGKVVTTVKANRFIKFWYKLFFGKNLNDKYDNSNTPPGMDEVEKSNNDVHLIKLGDANEDGLGNGAVYIDENGNHVRTPSSVVAKSQHNGTSTGGNTPSKVRDIDGEILPGSRRSYHTHRHTSSVITNNQFFSTPTHSNSQKRNSRTTESGFVEPSPELLATLQTHTHTDTSNTTSNRNSSSFPMENKTASNEEKEYVDHDMSYSDLDSQDHNSINARNY